MEMTLARVRFFLEIRRMESMENAWFNLFGKSPNSEPLKLSEASPMV